MTSLKHTLRLAVLAVATATMTAGVGVTVLKPAVAQSGITIFGGVDSEYRLRYLIDRNMPRSQDSRYYLQVTRSQIPRDVISLEIEYPESFTEQRGRLDLNAIQLRQGDWRGGEVIPVARLEWIPEERRIEIIPESPIPANTSFVIVMDNVRNPNRYGYHFFNLNMMYQGDVIERYVGTWPLELGVD